jgi:hypothetical protein
VPDRRRHRGPHPADEELFAPEQHAVLREALADLCWLLGRGYSDVAALELVGNRYELRARQRLAIQRCACSEAARAHRLAHRVTGEALRDRELVIDGFNCVVTLESALSGGLVLIGRDRACRDLASVHGSYRRVAETEAAVDAVARYLAAVHARSALWYLDRPVSNSGRLAALIRDVAAAHGLAWQVELVFAPDRELVTEPARVVASADAWVLDRAAAWVDLVGAIVAERAPGAWLLDLDPGRESEHR